METIIKLLIEVILFLGASYLIFYKSWLKSLGNEVAKLVTTKDLTQITESVKNDFNESIESYKSKLNEELSLKIEPIKAELNKQNISYQIQFAFLHQERGKVIVDLYKKLQELYSAMAGWTAAIQPIIEDAEREMEARAIRANKALIDFRNHFYLNKIFFSNSFCISIDEIIKVYWDKGWDFGYAQKRIKDGRIPPEYFKVYSTQLSDISKELKEKIPPMIIEIENLCRKILNVQEEDK